MGKNSNTNLFTIQNLDLLEFIALTPQNALSFLVYYLEEILDQTITGVKGIGGFETRGKFRWAMPKPLL